jgi:hypothetical protein
VNYGAATASLARQPSGGTAGGLLQTQPVVHLTAANGLWTPLEAATGTATATLVYGMYTGSGALSGTTNVTGVNGVFAFSDLSVDVAGNFYLQVSLAAPTGRRWTLYSQQFFVGGNYRAQEGPWAHRNDTTAGNADANATATGEWDGRDRGVIIASVLGGVVVGSVASLLAGFAVRTRLQRSAAAGEDANDNGSDTEGARTGKPSAYRASAPASDDMECSPVDDNGAAEWDGCDAGTDAATPAANEDGRDAIDGYSDPFAVVAPPVAAEPHGTAPRNPMLERF